MVTIGSNNKTTIVWALDSHGGFIIEEQDNPDCQHPMDMIYEVLDSTVDGRALLQCLACNRLFQDIHRARA